MHFLHIIILFTGLYTQWDIIMMSGMMCGILCGMMCGHRP
jgi:hypothetical protein